MKRITLIKASAFALAVTAMVAFASNEAQAQISLHGPYGGGIDISNRGVTVHGAGGHGSHLGGSRYGNYGGGNYGGNLYGGSSYGGGLYNNSRYRSSNFGGSYGGGYGGHGGYGYGQTITRRQPAHTWHDTSHYDYHPGQVVRHGNHFDYQPGHYDFHRTGHIDHNHR